MSVYILQVILMRYISFCLLGQCLAWKYKSFHYMTFIHNLTEKWHNIIRLFGIEQSYIHIDIQRIWNFYYVHTVRHKIVIRDIVYGYLLMGQNWPNADNIWHVCKISGGWPRPPLTYDEVNKLLLISWDQQVFVMKPIKLYRVNVFYRFDD